MKNIITLFLTAIILFIIFQYKTTYENSGSNNNQSNQIESHKHNSNNVNYNNSNNSNSNNNNPTKSKKSDDNITGNFLERSLSKIAINILKTPSGREFFENLIQPATKLGAIDKEVGFKIDNSKIVNSMFSINDFDLGKGFKAVCGQIANVNYSLYDNDDNILMEGKQTIQLGSNKIAPGVDMLITGMKVGQTRHARINSNL